MVKPIKVTANVIRNGEKVTMQHAVHCDDFDEVKQCKQVIRQKIKKSDDELINFTIYHAGQ